MLANTEKPTINLICTFFFLETFSANISQKWQFYDILPYFFVIFWFWTNEKCMETELWIPIKHSAQAQIQLLWHNRRSLLPQKTIAFMSSNTSALNIPDKTNSVEAESPGKDLQYHWQRATSQPNGKKMLLQQLIQQASFTKSILFWYEIHLELYLSSVKCLK